MGNSDSRASRTKEGAARPALRDSPLRNVIDGRLEAPAESLGDWIRDCNTGEQLFEMAASSREQVLEAIAAAQRVHDSNEWGGLSLERKCEWLNRVAEAMEKYEADMGVADAKETGVVLELTSIINGSLKGAFQSVAEGIERAELTKVLPGGRVLLCGLCVRRWLTRRCRALAGCVGSATRTAEIRRCSWRHRG